MKKRSKAARYGGFVIVVLFVAATFVANTGILNPKYEKKVNNSSFPIVYSKDNTLYVAPIGKNPAALSDFLTVSENAAPVVTIADSGNAVYFFENYDETTKSGSLFATFDGKEKIPVSGRAYKTVRMTEKGKRILYAESPDLERDTARICVWEKGKDKVQLTANGSLRAFDMSSDGEYIYYAEHDSDNIYGDLYMSHGGKSEKYDADVYKIVCVTDEGGVVYIKRSGDSEYALYYGDKNGKREKLSDFMTDFRASQLKSGRFIWCEKDTDGASRLMSFNNAVSALDDGAANILKADPSRNSVLYTKNFSPETYEYDVNLIYKGKESEKIASSNGNILNVDTSVDFKNTMYISDGALYVCEKGFGAEKERVKIAEDVESFKLSDFGTAAYVSGGKLYIYSGGKTFELADNVKFYRFTSDGAGICCIMNYDEAKHSGDLFVYDVKKPLKEPVRVDTNVMTLFYTRSAKDFVYIRNYSNDTGEGELCHSKNNKITVVDSGKIRILCEKY